MFGAVSPCVLLWGDLVMLPWGGCGWVVIAVPKCTELSKLHCPHPAPSVHLSWGFLPMPQRQAVKAAFSDISFEAGFST